MCPKPPFRPVLAWLKPTSIHRLQRRQLLTLAIETSCDDTAVAILEKNEDKAVLHFNEKISCNNAPWQGIHPLAALESHRTNLAGLIARAIEFLPEASPSDGKDDFTVIEGRRKPDFISVTRGPGMLSSLSTGIDTAKGLAVAWQIPVLGVHHMQAHALTPRLQYALEAKCQNSEGEEIPDSTGVKPEFPFLSLLVSGGHTLLLRSTSLTSHKILASTIDIALGDCLDKAARTILPPDALQTSGKPMFGPLLEEFAWPTTSTIPDSIDRNVRNGRIEDKNRKYEYDYKPPTSKSQDFINATTPTPYGWTLSPPFFLGDGGKQKNRMAFSFAGINTYIDRVAKRGWDFSREKLSLVSRETPMPLEEARFLARETMRVTFEHLASRVLIALEMEREQQGEVINKEKKKKENTSWHVTKKGDHASTPIPDSGITNTNSMKEPQKPPKQTQRKRKEKQETRSQPHPPTTKSLVLSGGVASNSYLRHILTSYLTARGFPELKIIAPSIHLCTDNAAMIAWAGCEMYELQTKARMEEKGLSFTSKSKIGSVSDLEKQESRSDSQMGDKPSSDVISRRDRIQIDDCNRVVGDGLGFLGLRKWSLENLMRPEVELELVSVSDKGKSTTSQAHVDNSAADNGEI